MAGDTLLPDSFQFKTPYFCEDQQWGFHRCVSYKLQAVPTRLKDSYVLFSGNKYSEYDVLVPESETNTTAHDGLGVETRRCDRIVKSLRLLLEHSGLIFGLS
jgi:DNA-directed RNA polymerase subunit N (RpoN/RPB10)